MDDMIKLGNQMDTSKKSYQEAMTKLYNGNGNMIRRAEKMKELGAKVQKKLPQALLDRMNDTEAIQ